MYLKCNSSENTNLRNLDATIFKKKKKITHKCTVKMWFSLKKGTIRFFLLIKITISNINNCYKCMIKGKHISENS